jgi:hypothetical protein
MRRLLFQRWTVMLALSICLLSCGGEEEKIDEEPFTVVESDIPGMYFEIPEGALPADFDPADIKITPLPSPADPTTSKDGVQRQAWKLTPDGARFEKPIRLVIPFEQSIPAIFHRYDDKIEWVQGVHYKMTVGGNTASVPLKHFSVVRLVIAPVQNVYGISGVAADTMIGESIDVQVKFTMLYSDTGVDAPRGVDAEFMNLNIELPQNRVACPDELAGCTIRSESENIRGGKLNLEPDPKEFKDQFTLHSDDLVCEAAGKGQIEVAIPVIYIIDGAICESLPCRPRPGLAIFILEIPVFCIEGQFDVNVLTFTQRASSYVMSSEAATSTDHQRSIVEEFELNPITGRSEIISTSTKDYVESSVPTYGASYEQVSLGQEASVPVGVGALAEISTLTSHSPLDFSVVGELSLDAYGMDDMDPKNWSVSGTAEVEWGMSVTIRQASIIQIENCDLFNQESWTQYPDFQRVAGNCMFRINGSSNFEMPNIPGLGKISRDRTTSNIDDEHVESKRLLDLTSGQVVMFRLNVDQTETVSFSTLGPKSARKESFVIHIRPDFNVQSDR